MLVVLMDDADLLAIESEMVEKHGSKRPRDILMKKWCCKDKLGRMTELVTSRRMKLLILEGGGCCPAYSVVLLLHIYFCSGNF